MRCPPPSHGLASSSAQAGYCSQHVEAVIAAGADGDVLDVLEVRQGLLEMRVALVMGRGRGQLERRTERHEERRTPTESRRRLLEQRRPAEATRRVQRCLP